MGWAASMADAAIGANSDATRATTVEMEQTRRMVTANIPSFSPVKQLDSSFKSINSFNLLGPPAIRVYKSLESST